MTDNYQSDSLRLNKFLAHQTGVSRREADNLIIAGKVSVDGVVAELGARINSQNKVTVAGQTVQMQAENQYIMLHKPAGYVCSRHAQGDNPTIYALLPDSLASLKPVGRLDKNSSGLILLTNDGDFAYQMTHPKFFKQKVYFVTLKQDLEPLHQQIINQHQVLLDGTPSRLNLDRDNENDRKQWRVTMSEGRNRQIRRTFQSLGYDITELHRTVFGKFTLGNLPSGKFQSVDV